MDFMMILSNLPDSPTNSCDSPLSHSSNEESMEVFQSEANSPVVRSGSEEATSSSSSGVSSAMSEILNVSVLGGFMGGESESLTMSARKQQGRLFSKVQLRELEARFDLSPHVEPEEIGQLAAVLELHPVQVKTWFTNRRNRIKKKLEDLTNSETNGVKVKRGVGRPRKDHSAVGAAPTRGPPSVVVKTEIDASGKKTNTNPADSWPVLRFSGRLRSLLLQPRHVSLSDENMKRYRVQSEVQSPPTPPPQQPRYPSLTMQMENPVAPLYGTGQVDDLLSTARFFTVRQATPMSGGCFVDNFAMNGCGMMAFNQTPPMSLSFPELDRLDFHNNAATTAGNYGQGQHGFFDETFYYAL